MGSHIKFDQESSLMTSIATPNILYLDANSGAMLQQVATVKKHIDTACHCSTPIPLSGDTALRICL
jgi:hypothetical protein